MSHAGGARPLELEFPDIRAHAAGNGGIPYVHSFAAAQPGPHVMINALTHGNEVCGAIVVDELLRHGLRPRRGRLTLAFANAEAFHAFDPARPDASRFVNQDLNRVWNAALLDDTGRDSVELRRARALRPLIDTVDLLFDLHSMHEHSQPLLLSGPLPKGIALARALGVDAPVIVDAGHAEGRRLRDYAHFGDAASPRNALLIECGQHWERGAAGVARNSTGRFLVQAGCIDAADLPAGWIRPDAAPSRVVQVTDAVVARGMDFRFAADYTGLERIPEADSVIAWNEGEPVRTPYDDCILVMPSLRQLRAGVTVVRLGRLID